MTLGQKIQILRTEAGLSQTQLAEALNVSRSAIAKWENDNGMPDIENLRVLADYFHMDVDQLIDPSRELEIPKPKQVAQPRPNSYCGKSCDHCTHKEALDCPGCKAGPGKRFSEKCDIAKCGRGRNILYCEHCSDYHVCSTIRRKEKIPAIRLENRKREEERRERINAVAPYGAKCFFVMFLLAIALDVCGIFTSFEFFSDFRVLVTSAKIAQTTVALGYGAVMLCLSKFESRFRTAGMLTILTALTGLLMWYLDGREVLKNLTYVLLLPSAIFGMISTYNEYTACADLVYEASEDSYHSWLLLRKLYFGAMIGYVVSIVTVLITPLLGLIGMIGCNILILVTGVIRIVNLYRTMLIFRYYL